MFPTTLTYEPKHNETVKQHWKVTFAHQRKSSVTAKRILSRIFDQIRLDDFTLRDYYQMRITDIVTDAAIEQQTAYKDVKGALNELLDMRWDFEELDGSAWHSRHLLDTTKERTVGYKDGIITILLNPQLQPYFVQIAHYTQYDLKQYMNLRSWYSMRLYEILSTFRDTGVWHVSIEDYRKLIDCWAEKDKFGRDKKKKDGSLKMKYPNSFDLINKTLQEPLKEFEKTPLAFEVETIYEQRIKQGRPKVVALKFTLKNPTNGKIPDTWLKHPDILKTIENLRKFKVTDHNIAKYLVEIGTPAANKLVYDWMMKENTNDRINDKVKYCNAVFVRLGKEAHQMVKDQIIESTRKKGVEVKL